MSHLNSRIGTKSKSLPTKLGKPESGGGVGAGVADADAGASVSTPAGKRASVVDVTSYQVGAYWRVISSYHKQKNHKLTPALR